MYKYTPSSHLRPHPTPGDNDFNILDWIKMAQWFWKRSQEREKVETRTDRQTNRQTGTGQNVIRKAL